jgi:kinesin family protein 13
MKEKMEKERLKVDCHFKNINEDPMLSGAVKKIMFDGQNNIGKKDPYNSVSLEIGGMGVAPKHGMFKYNEGMRTGTVFPNHEDAQKFKTYVNGELIEQPTEIKHGDRVLFGNHNYFIFCDPKINPEENYDWE